MQFCEDNVVFTSMHHWHCGKEQCRKKPAPLQPKHNNNPAANPPPSFPKATFYIESSETETSQAQKQEVQWAKTTITPECFGHVSDC